MKKNSTSSQSPKRAIARQQGPITIGMDLGDKTSRYCVLDGNGERLSEGSVATTRRAMATEVFRDAPVPRGDGSGHAFALVEPMADQSGI
jgi:hypothetical protein